MSESIPLVVGGVLYTSTGYNRVIALDAETGHKIWEYESKHTPALRGVSYWPGTKGFAPAIVFGTLDGWLISLDAKTGKPNPGFGAEGLVNLRIGVTEKFPKARYAITSPPSFYRDLVITGSSPGEEPTFGATGDIRAWDMRNGKLVWTFHTLPRPGEPNHEVWQDGQWEGRAGVNSWSFITVDVKRGMAFVPIGTPNTDFYGGDRKGSNLYGSTLVALDAATGKLKWYFQTTHHDNWDYDLASAPILITTRQNGKTIPAVAQITKQGYLFIFDRLTGKPVFGVEERPVPQGDAPGEWYAATQPFPLKPPPLARVSIKREDIVTADDTSAEHAKACQEVWDKRGFRDSGPFTPWVYQAEGTPEHDTITIPGATGGTNWGGATADPESGYVFVNSQDSPSAGWIRKNPNAKEEGQLPYDMRPGFLGFNAPYKDAEGKPLGNLPCIKPPWERLFAVNANTGDIAWQVPLGVTDFLPPEKRNTGRAGAFAGPIATAGGLVFIGATSDARFRAFDAKNGKELWTQQLDYAATANPITYRGKSGKQYVAIVAAGPGKGNNQALMVFALPRN